MIGVDTNVFVRFLMEVDDAEQRRLVLELFDADVPVFVGHVVLAEAIWLLLNTYRYPAPAVRDALLGAAASPTIEFEEPASLFQLLSSGELSVQQSADYLIAATNRRHGCTKTVTFDRRAARNLDGMELLA